MSQERTCAVQYPAWPVPGPRYTDHHVHFLATVAAHLSVDVSAARDVAAILEILAAVPGHGWMRAWGYEEWALAENRHPTVEELDGATPGRPVVLHHRSGHAAVLNSAALAEVGGDPGTSGLLIDRHDLLSRVPRLDRRDLERAAAQVSADWQEAGIVSFTDATHTNGPEELELLAGWHRGGVIQQEMAMMVGPEWLASVPPFGSSAGGVTVGPVKLMAADALNIAAAHAAGFPVAVHVVEPDGLAECLSAFAASPPPAWLIDRVEHNALCLPDQVDELARLPVAVVVNPSFLIHRRRKYESEVSPVEQSWLIRVGSLLAAGVTVRAGSDSPVAPARPEEIIAAATGHPLAPDESVSVQEAFRLLSPL
jgi:predicted amidohydrolase YtcJ